MKENRNKGKSKGNTPISIIIHTRATSQAYTTKTHLTIHQDNHTEEMHNLMLRTLLISLIKVGVLNKFHSKNLPKKKTKKSAETISTSTATTKHTIKFISLRINCMRLQSWKSKILKRMSNNRLMLLLNKISW